MKRLLLLVALLLGLSLSASAQVQQSKLPPCPKPDYSKNTHLEKVAKWHNCFGRYLFELNDNNIGDVYEGDFQNGFPNGKGTYIFSSGDKYLGEYKDGNKHGLGTYTYASGNIYVGEFKDNTIEGQGTFYFLAKDNFEGDKYVGSFKDGKRSGRGTYYFLANNQYKGDLYFGDFKDDEHDGFGTYIYSKGGRFVGEWKDGLPNGKGIETFTDGRLPNEGTFSKGNFVKVDKVDLVLLQLTGISSLSNKNLSATRVCEEFKDYADFTNTKTPLVIDNITFVTKILVKCDTNTISYFMKINIGEKFFIDNWKIKKQEQHTQIHCDTNGLSKKYGMTVRDVITYSSREVVEIFETTPLNCN